MAKRLNKRNAKKPAQSSSNRRRQIIFGVIAVGVIGLGYLLYLGLQPAGVITGLVNFGRQSRGHDDTLHMESADLPPVGGTHHSIWQNCGVYDSPVSTENAVHSMEHGAAWITYQPDLPAEEVAALQEYARAEEFVILSPFPGLRSPVVVSAWSVQIELDSASDDRMEEFVERYRLGPTTPELGATCSDGVGEPLS